MFPLGVIGGAAQGITAAANAPTAQSIEATLSAKTNPVFANSFAVGRGATATSTPTVGAESSPLGIPPLYLFGGAGLLVLVALLARR